MLRRHGADSVQVALRRAAFSAVRNDAAAVSEWHLVLATLNAYLAAEPGGAPH